METLKEWCIKNHKENLLNEWDYHRNKSTPDTVSYKLQKKVWWKDEKGHSWETQVVNRTIKHTGCPVCSNRQLLVGFNDLETKFPKLAKEFDIEKNCCLPKEIIAAGDKKYFWKCDKGHSYQAALNKRVERGNGCPYCSGHQVLKGFNDLATTNPELLKEWDFEKNKIDPSKVSKGSGIKVYWKCSNGHSFISTIIGRTNFGHNCPYCSHTKVLKGFNDLATTNPELAKEWHPLKNGRLKPSDVFEKSGKKVWWVCSHGHEWQQSPHLRSKGKGCPVCSNELHVSFPEKVFYFYLNKNFKAFENFNPGWSGQRNIDIYIPSLKVGIEYDGANWHKNEDSDITKNKLCEKYGIKLIRIREVGCPILKDNSSYNYIFDGENFQDAINFILNVINKLTRQKFVLKIDLINDRAKINELVLSSEKKTNICITNPDVVKEWDYEKNGLLKPEFLTYGSDKKVWWKCSKCGHSWLAPVSRRCRLGRGCPICCSSKSHSSHKKQVSQFSLDGTHIKDYESIKEAIAETKIKNINSVLRGNSKTAGGFVWKYK